jgi:hypothetical protein
MLSSLTGYQIKKPPGSFPAVIVIKIKTIYYSPKKGYL